MHRAAVSTRTAASRCFAPCGRPYSALIFSVFLGLDDSVRIVIVFIVDTVQAVLELHDAATQRPHQSGQAIAKHQQNDEGNNQQLKVPNPKKPSIASLSHKGGRVTRTHELGDAQ